MAFPKFIYETLGTAMFVIVSSCAVQRTRNEDGKITDTSTAALFYALSWCLMHTTFKTHSQAFFNPVLTLGEYVVKGLEDTAEMVLTIVGQILGSMVGASVLGALNSDIKLPLPDLSGHSMPQNLVWETLAVAALVYLFFSKPEQDITACLWAILVFFVMFMVAGSRMNPALYMNNVILGAVQGKDAWGGPSSADVSVMVGSVCGGLSGALIRKYMD